MKLSDILLPYQKNFAFEKTHRKIWCSSRQVGKSFTLAFIACYKALERDGNLSLCISTGLRASNELMKKILNFAESVKILTNNKLTYTSTADTIKFSNGSRIISLPSGNPQALRGYTAACVIIDECAFIERLEDVFQSILPTLTRNKNADLILASTPGGTIGKFYELFTEENDFYKQSTTIYDAINDGLCIDINEIKKLCPDDAVFQQEYCCQFAKNFGSFIDTSILDYYDEEVKFQDYFVGIDVGRHSDATAITILGRTPESKIYLDNLVLLKDTPYQEQFNIVQELNKNIDSKLVVQIAMVLVVHLLNKFKEQ